MFVCCSFVQMIRDNFSQLRDDGFLFERQPQTKRVDGWGVIAGERQRAPRTVGCPRPRVQVTWADERAAHGVTQTGSYWQSAPATAKETRRRRRRGAASDEAPSATRRRQRRRSNQKLTSACARRQCLPLSRRTHHHPLSPPICLVFACWGADGFIAKLRPQQAS